jgi:hypothetical protein
MYLLSIIVAEVRHGERITSLPQFDLRNNIEWALNQDWVDTNTKVLLRIRMGAFIPMQTDARPHAGRVWELE